MPATARAAGAAAVRNPVGSAAPWYADGVRFECRRCGNCCAGRGSVVRVSDREVEALAREVAMSVADFRSRHTAEAFEETVLRDKEGTDGECEWLVRDDAGTTGCSVQDAKPEQCRAYPFWPRVVQSRGAWDAEGRSCAGIGEGPRIDADEIERRLGLDRLREQLDTLFEELDYEVREMGATCWMRGNCCDFPAAGHRLFASRLEAERFARGVDLGGWDPQSGLCPAWKDRRCTAREHRPTGCRVYFCDPAYEERVHELMERYVTRLKWLHERHGIPWDYRDLLAHLADVSGQRTMSPDNDR